MPPPSLPPSANHCTLDKLGAAVELVAQHSAGTLSFSAVRDLGSIVVGRGLDHCEWRLVGPRQVPLTHRARAGTPDAQCVAWSVDVGARATLPVRLAPSGAVFGMWLAVDAAFAPQRVRIGTRWVKDASGKVREDCVPATDLSPDQLARWLRRRFFVEIEPETHDEDRSMKEGGTDDGCWRLAHASMSEFSLRGAVHQRAPSGLRGPSCLPCERWTTDDERLARLALTGSLEGRKCDVLLLHVAGSTEAQIASTLGCADRTVRRDLGSVRAKARLVAPDDFDYAALPASLLPLHDQKPALPEGRRTADRLAA